MHHKRSSADLVKIIGALLEVKNRNSQQIKFAYDHEKRSISLRGAALKSLRVYNYGYKTSFLTIIDPLILSLSGTKVNDMEELKGLQLLELDLRGMGDISNISALKQMRSLRKLFITKGQLTASQKKLLPVYLSIIEKDK